MKAKVVIENGETDIVLTPENDFEKDLIEKVKEGEDKKIWNVYTSVNIDKKYNYGTYELSNHEIIINLKETR